jgi:hypothetical protein
MWLLLQLLQVGVGVLQVKLLLVGVHGMVARKWRQAVVGGGCPGTWKSM